MEKGRATGPQKRPRKQAGATVKPRPEPEVIAGDARREGDVLRTAYGAIRQRMIEEAEMILMTLNEMPEADLLRSASQELRSAMAECERRLSLTRLELSQLGDTL